MKRKVVILGLILTLLVLPVAACAKPAPAPAPAPAPTPAPAPAPAPAPTPAPAPPSEEVITWTFAIWPGADSNVWSFHPVPRFQNLVEERTGGRLKLNTIVNLVPSSEVPFAVMDGRADIGIERTTFVSGTFPLLDFVSIPFTFIDIYSYERVVSDPRVLAILEPYYEEFGLKRLFDCAAVGFNVVFSNKPVATIEDFDGLKVRAGGIFYTMALQKLGAAPLTMAIIEISEALERGTVDAVHTAVPFGIGMGMGDVTDYACMWPFSVPHSNFVMANLDSFNELPADLQEILVDTCREFEAQTFLAAYCSDRHANNVMRHTELEVIVPEQAEVDKAKAIVAPAIKEKWLELAGPHAAELYDLVMELAPAPE